MFHNGISRAYNARQEHNRMYQSGFMKKNADTMGRFPKFHALDDHLHRGEPKPIFLEPRPNSPITDPTGFISPTSVTFYGADNSFRPIHGEEVIPYPLSGAGRNTSNPQPFRPRREFLDNRQRFSPDPAAYNQVRSGTFADLRCDSIPPTGFHTAGSPGLEPLEPLRLESRFSTAGDNGAHGSRTAVATSPLEPRSSRPVLTSCLPCSPNTSKDSKSVRPAPQASSPSKSQRPKSGTGLRTPRNPRTPSNGPTANGVGGNSPPDTSTPGNPTPQNLRDNPERQAKIKTEMCQHFLEGGIENCPWGDRCNYAHGVHELKFQYTSLLLMENAGQITNAQTYLARPCLTWTSTGACPFGRRCSSIHDPRVQGPREYPAWLPVASAKTSAKVIVDQLSLYRENEVHAENALVPQTIWEHCRPSRSRSRYGNVSIASAFAAMASQDREWDDTYALVCNSGVRVFHGTNELHQARAAQPTERKLSELQKLCIVVNMRTKDSKNDDEDKDEKAKSLHRDYLFAPTHEILSELCMVIQVRYYHLPNVDFTKSVSPEDIAREISAEEYRCRTVPWSGTDNGYHYSPSEVVSVHEVAFGPKGDVNSNISFWFDCNAIELDQSQIKKARRIKQTKKTRLRTGHSSPNKNGALIARLSPVDFAYGAPKIDPFVPMIPAEDNDESQELITEIWKLRIDSLISDLSSSASNATKIELRSRMETLSKSFEAMNAFRKKWTYPKREGMEKVTEMTRAPATNIIPYTPSDAVTKNNTNEIWDDFVSSILHDFENFDMSNTESKMSLHVFARLRNKRSVGAKRNVPRIRRKTESDSMDVMEVFLGNQSFEWQQAHDLHKRNKAASPSTGRHMPLSTVPFVQALEE